jgi:CDP-diacylglycerol--serine O-phosphatidyltransferase
MSSVPAPYSAEESVAPERRGIRKGLYLIPSLFTAANIGMGFYAVMSALKGFQVLGIEGTEKFQAAAFYFDNAAKAIGWAFLFDALDGRIARITKTTTEIGVQFDSIADVVTFGLAPAILVYAWGYGSALEYGGDLHNLGLFLSFMYLMCGAFRLARFNVQSARPRPLAEGTVKLDKKNFIGLPIPPAATLLASIIHFAPQPLAHYEPRLRTLYSGLLMALVGFLGALMVSTLRYTSFKTAGTRRRSARVMILLVASIGMLIWYFSRYVLLALAILYVTHGLLFRLGAVFRRRPAKETLANSPHHE